MNKDFARRFGVPPRYTLGYNYLDQKAMIKRKNGNFLSFKSIKRLIMSIQSVLLNKAMVRVVYQALDKYSYDMNDPDIDCQIRFVKHRLNRQSIRHEDIRREWADEK